MIPDDWVERGAEAIVQQAESLAPEYRVVLLAGKRDLARAVLETLPIKQVGWWNDISGAHGGVAPHPGCLGADVPVYVLSGDAQ